MKNIILAPVITEKSMFLVKQGKYTFRVSKTSNKNKIKKAMKDKFGVDAISVLTMNVKAKKKNMQRHKYEVPGFKKAIVKVKEGQKIDLFEIGGKK